MKFKYIVILSIMFSCNSNKHFVENNECFYKFDCKSLRFHDSLELGSVAMKANVFNIYEDEKFNILELNLISLEDETEINEFRVFLCEERDKELKVINEVFYERIQKNYIKISKKFKGKLVFWKHSFLTYVLDIR